VTEKRAEPLKILAIDVGGTHVKVLTNHGTEKRQVESGPTMTAAMMVDAVREMTKDWSFDVVSIGYPGPVKNHQPQAEPHNLAPGWVGFDYEKAFGKPVRIVNDAAMQALGSYQGGRMLFLGLGTGLGSAMVIDGILVPMELAHLPYKHDETFEDYVGTRGLEKHGHHHWRKAVADVVARLAAALQADSVVLGGGNAKLFDVAPAGARLGDNENAFRGGFLLWQDKVKT
jgi:polyphosphate glucokinase